MKKLKSQLTTKVFDNLISNKLLVLQKCSPEGSNVASKTYTKSLAKQLNLASLISLKKFKFPLSLFIFSNFFELQAYFNSLQKRCISSNSVVLTKIKSNIVLKSQKNLNAFNSKQTFLQFSSLFRSSVLILKTLKMFK